VEQRFGRNAPGVKTNAAQARMLLYERHLFTPVCRIERRRISSWASAEHDNFGFDRVHG
jgi:hypothetical protein